MSLWMWISVLFVFLILSYLLVTNVWFQNCFSYRFTILIRQDLPLYYFRTNTSLSSVGTQQILYQDLFIKVKQCFCKVSRRVRVLCISFLLQGRGFLIACYILYPGPFQKIRATANKTKNVTFQTEVVSFIYFGYF